MVNPRSTIHPTKPVAEKRSNPNGTAARLEMLLAENAKFAELESRSSSIDFAQQEALIKNPVDTEMALAILGLLTGSIPTTAIFFKIISDINDIEAAGVLAILLLVSVAVTAAAGFYSGKLVGRILSDLEKKPWIVMLAALPFIGAVWGLLSGAAGGFILFGFGALLGGSIGSLVGAAVLFAFGILHRVLKKGDSIERGQFLPVALGITAAIAAFILGL